MIDYKPRAKKTNFLNSEEKLFDLKQKIKDGIINITLSPFVFIFLLIKKYITLENIHIVLFTSLFCIFQIWLFQFTNMNIHIVNDTNQSDAKMIQGFIYSSLSAMLMLMTVGKYYWFCYEIPEFIKNKLILAPINYLKSFIKKDNNSNSLK